MAPRCSLLMLLVLASLGCKDDKLPAPDAAVIDAAADVAAADVPAVDAPTDLPVPDGRAGDVSPSCPDVGSYAQGCVEGQEWGCCGDNANIPQVCVAGQWECPMGSVLPPKCCAGFNGHSCVPLSLDPRCSAYLPDGGLPRD